MFRPDLTFDLPDEFEKEAGKAWAEKVYRVVDGGYAN